MPMPQPVSEESPTAIPAWEADALLNEDRVAEFISINPRTLQQWRLKGIGPPFVRISSRCLRYRYRDLLAWVEQRIRTSTSER